MIPAVIVICVEVQAHRKREQMAKQNRKELFPDPNEADAQGLVAVGGTLDSSTLAEAYRQGIFPWPTQGLPMLWFSPDPRAIIDFDDFHLPRSFLKWKKKFAQEFHLTVNKDFESVIRACAQQPRPGQAGTWITEEIVQAYSLCFQQGWAYSIEIWKNQSAPNEKNYHHEKNHHPVLVGGLYGILQPNYASAESMFHHESNCSKLALQAAVDFLKTRGYRWVDIQMLTEITKSFGGKEIPRRNFLNKIQISKQNPEF